MGVFDANGYGQSVSTAAKCIGNNHGGEQEEVNCSCIF